MSDEEKRKYLSFLKLRFDRHRVKSRNDDMYFSKLVLGTLQQAKYSRVNDAHPEFGDEELQLLRVWVGESPDELMNELVRTIIGN
jgi:hypothetical protein